MDTSGAPVDAEVVIGTTLKTAGGMRMTTDTVVGIAVTIVIRIIGK